MQIEPFPFMVAANTESPVSLVTGILSPVSIDSSIVVVPSVTIPSTGILLPGFTSKISPIKTSLMGISISLPSFLTMAVLGASPINFFIAWEVLPFETDSNVLPSRIKVIIMPTDSK